MKNSGFTLVELLAVIIIMGILMIITIPAYTSIYSGIKRNNLSGKLSEINSAAMKFGQKVKDDVKNKGAACYETNVAELVEGGYLVSELDNEPAILNPTDNRPLDGTIKICYCEKDFDIKAYYTQEFDKKKMYYEDDYVTFEGKLYQCEYQFPGGVDIISTNADGKKYFKEITSTDC